MHKKVDDKKYADKLEQSYALIRIFIVNNFELSTYILHQVFPLLNGRDHQDLVTTPIQVWFNEAGELTFADDELRQTFERVFKA